MDNLRPQRSDAVDVTQSKRKTITLRARWEAQGPQGWRVQALGISLERQGKLEQARHEVVAWFMGRHCRTVVSSGGGW